MCKQIKDVHAFQIKILYRRVDIASPRPAEEVDVEAMGSPSLIQVKEGRGEPEAEQVSRDGFKCRIILMDQSKIIILIDSSNFII